MKHQRLWELTSLTVLGLAAFGGIIWTLHLAKNLNSGDGQVVGIAIGAFATAIPVIIQAIRNIGQGQAMQSLVDHLANSAPTMDAGPVPKSAADAARQTAAAADDKAEQIEGRI